MLKQGRVIFYSWQIHGPLIPDKEYFFDNHIKEKYHEARIQIIDILLNEGFKTKEIIRPEIYKHKISFSLLSDFQDGDIHLILKPMEYIRPLKNAYNIWVKVGSISIYYNKDFHPFCRPRKMTQLINEIWNCTPDDLGELKVPDGPLIFDIYDIYKKDSLKISRNSIITRLKQIYIKD